MELFDLYDAHRMPTGKTMVRGTATPKGMYRLVVHICIFNSEGKLLIQQRQGYKKTWKNMWDISVGGAVISGENSQTAAHRELLEELGLNADFENLLPTFTTTFKGGIDDVYILHWDVNLSDVKLQPEEVQSVKWADCGEILSMIDEERFIPYGKEFIEYLFFRSTHSGNFQIDK